MMVKIKYEKEEGTNTVTSFSDVIKMHIGKLGSSCFIYRYGNSYGEHDCLSTIEANIEISE